MAIILSYNPILGSYDRIQHIIILGLDLVRLYLNLDPTRCDTAHDAKDS